MIKLSELRPIVISTRRPLILQENTLVAIHGQKRGGVKHQKFFFKDTDEYLSYLRKMNGHDFLVYDHLPRHFHEMAILERLRFAIITLPRRTVDGHEVSITVFEGREMEKITHIAPYNKKWSNFRKKYARW